MIFSMMLRKCCCLLFITVLHGSFLYGMTKVAKNPEPKNMVEAQQRYSRGVSRFLDLLDDRDIPDYCEPYNCFKSLLGSSGEPMRELRALSAYNLGLMCKVHLGVPKSENGITSAQLYFLQAVDEGHIQAVGELARCASTTGSYAKAFELLCQQRFLEICHDCRIGIGNTVIGDGISHDEYLVEQAAKAVNVSVSLPAYIKQQLLYREAIETLIAVLKEPALRDNKRARCLLAHLYATKQESDHMADDVIQLLTPVLSSCSSTEINDLINTTKAHDALKIVADAGNVTACACLGIASYQDQKYDKAYYYCNKASQAGDLRARFYCICMKINGRGTQRSLHGAAREIQELAKTEVGRQSLSTLAHMCDAGMRDILFSAKAKQRESALFIHGVILYETHEDDALAYNYLNVCASQHNVYACYCCAQMLLQGRGIERSLDGAASMYAQVLATDSIDDRMRTECTYALRELAHSGSIPGACEYCIALLHHSVPIEEFKKDINLIFDSPQIEHAKYVSYFQSPSCTQALMKAKNEHNPRAMLILGALQKVQADLSQKIDTKLQLLHSAFENMSMAHQQQVATDKELSDVAMYLADELKEKGSSDKAKKYVELAAKLGDIEAKCVLANLIINDKNASSHDLVRALGYFEESALQGNVDNQRFLAQVYRRDQQWCASSARIVADFGKAYAFVNMLLKSNPDDIEGRYILGYLLGTHGGKSGIPAGQTVMAYELLSSVIDQMEVVLPADYYLLGRVSFANGNYEQAMSWFDRAGDFSNCNCYRGLIMLIEAEKGNKRLDRNSAFECIEKSLSEARKFIIVKQVGYCELFRHELLIKILNEEADKGDLRARTMLARIAYLFEDETFVISKQKAFSYLVESAVAGVAFARSFLGFMFFRGVEVPQSCCSALEYFISVIHDKKVPNFVRDEVAEELFAMGRESVISPISISVGYNAVVALLHNATPENVQRAIMSIGKAESDLINHFTENKELSSLIYRSGAWGALQSIAEQGNGNVAATLGMLVVLRFVRGFDDFDFVRTQGLPLLELALKHGATNMNAVDVSKQYVNCVRCAFKKGLHEFPAFCTLLDRAQQLNPKCQDVPYCLSIIYLNYKFPDDQKEKFIEQGKVVLEKLVDEGHRQAAFDLGLQYLGSGKQGTYVGCFIKAIHYLKIAAKAGDNYALSVLVATYLAEKTLSTKRTKNEILDAIDFLLGQSTKTKEEKLFFLCMKAVMSNQAVKVSGFIEQLSQSAEGLPLCVLACMVVLPLKEGLQKYGGLFLKALEMIGINHIDIVVTEIVDAIRSILLSLNLSVAGDAKIANYEASAMAIIGKYRDIFKLVL